MLMGMALSAYCLCSWQNHPMWSLRLVYASPSLSFMGWPISDIDSGLSVSKSILNRFDTESKLFCLAIYGLNTQLPIAGGTTQWRRRVRSGIGL